MGAPPPLGPVLAGVVVVAANASAEEQAAFTRMIATVADITGIAESGFRVISNIGQDGHQEVPHLHMHVLGGEPVGRMLARS